MVSHDTVRGADGKIVNAAGAPYDPAKAADAKRVENDPQALFFIKHPQGETYARPPLAGTVGDEVNGNEQNIAIADIPSEKGALGVAINYTIDASTLAPAAVGRVTLRVVNASGETVATLTEDETVTPGTVTIGAASIPAELIDGPLQVEINGVGFYSVVIDYVVTYQDTPFIVLTWDDVTLG